ncbi:MAG: zonular occludens toxin domain-containing protein [Candidatus Woesearchaeota archaeon]
MHDIVIGRDEADRKKYANRGTILVGKHYVQMGQTTSLSNNIYLDIARAHAMFVCGKRGGGKCLTGDTLITLGDSTQKTIEQLFNEYTSDGIAVSKDYYKLSQKITVLSFNISQQKIEKKSVTHMFRRKVKEKLVKWTYIINEKPITLITTKDHKILTILNDFKQSLRFNFEWDSYLSQKNLHYFVSHNKNKIDPVKIESYQEIDFEGYVYDLTVPENHNFVANDIIVHNSYTLGVIAEGLSDIEPEIAQNLSIILIDTMGIYWTMKYPNKQDEDLLKQWSLEAKGLDVKIYTPIGYYQKYKDEGIPTDYPFSIRPSELTSLDWCMTFNTDSNSEQGVLISRVIYELQEKQQNYSIQTIIDAVTTDTDASDIAKQAVINLFKNANTWGLFSDTATPLSQLAQGGQVSVLDVSCYATQQGGWTIKQLAVGIVAQKLFIQRMLERKDEEFKEVHNIMNYFSEDDSSKKQQYPLVWLVIDEAHEFLPNDKTVASSDPLITILREGRQPGISVILATQQPGKIHTDVLTQSDTVLSHRITAKLDTDALGTLMQSYMRTGLVQALDTLPRVKGAGIIFDDTNEKMFPMRIRPRFTWHGGSSPSAVPKTKKYFE